MHKNIIIFLASITLFLALCSSLGTSGTGFNQSDVIYMVMTDRFCDGDSSNNNFGRGEYRPGDLHYHQGGDLQGIINKLGYLKDLGVTAIWITPVVENQWINSNCLSTYHGYAAHDFYKTDPHLGSMQDLSSLVSAANSRGIDIIIDVVANHSGDYLEPGASGYTRGSPAAPFNNPAWYHHNGDIRDWGSQYQIENYDLCGLDDISHENDAASNEIIDVYRYWIRESGCQGFRVDTIKHMPKSFVSDFDSAMSVPCFGEVYHSEVDYVADYQNYMQGVIDFPMYYTIESVFAHDNSCYQLGDRLSEDSKYNDPNWLITFIDNHDVQRFLYRTSGDWSTKYDKLKIALGFIFTIRGIPCVYYGTEQGYAGTPGTNGKDPYNREVLTSWDESHEIYEHISKLSEIRSSHPALQVGSQYEMWKDDQIYSYLRKSGSDEVIVVLNNGYDSQSRNIPLRDESGIDEGTQLQDLLSGRTITVSQDREIQVDMEPKSMIILASA